MQDTFLIIDGNSLLHRAFHALPLMDANGIYTNAIHGFLQMILKVIKDEQAQYVAVCFDEHGPTFRHTAYPDYKAGRAATPPELRQQFETIRTLLDEIGVKRYGLTGWEADDLLGTLSLLGEKEGVSPLLLTGDRDALQLVDDRIQLMFTRKGISETTRFTPDKVREEYGFGPEQVTDWKALAGDSSDNIPGIQGIGDKTAVKLLQQYGDLDAIFAHADEVKGKMGERLRAGKEVAYMYKELATIHRDAPVAFRLEDCRMPDLTKAVPALRRLRLNQIIRRFIGESDTERVSSPMPDSMNPQEPAGTAPASMEHVSPDSAMNAESQTVQTDKRNMSEPVLLAFSEEEKLEKAEAIDAWMKTGNTEEADCQWALWMTEEGITLADTAGRYADIPLGQELFHMGMDPAEALTALAPFLQTGRFITHDGKRLLHTLDTCHLPIPETMGWDTMLGAYLLNPQEKSFAFAALHGVLPLDARGVLSLAVWQKQQIAAEGMEPLMREVEIPLSFTLFRMEKQGFRVDGSFLRRLGKKYTEEIEELKQQIYLACGAGEFNINSPKQLGDILFEKLQLPHGKKTSRGYSTAVEVLEEVRSVRPDVIDPILRYRQIAKLNNTYIEGLLPLMDADGRVHSFFDQTGTATGRISSSEPNLQNIPVRTEEGKEIREAFLPQDGWTIVDADYSQIELRLMAHFSGDAALVDAFCHGQDIHARTASEIFDVPMDQVTSELRSKAKAVNFGLIYGISSFGLAKNANVSRYEAAEFIKRYFARYPGVKRFMDQCVSDGMEHGYATTVMGRRRYLPELESSKAAVREFGKRAAMNTPVQGTAADIIKLAMVRVDEALRREHMASRLILQVHDELILECPPDEVEKASTLLRECMENVTALKVPLVAEVHQGTNWAAAK